MTDQTPARTPPSDEAPLVVEMRGIVKRFPGVLANDHVDFQLRQGEIHALLGENGAGKSTLMNILAGLYKAEAGSILVNGKSVSFSSPRDAIQSGIGMIHQHFMLVPTQTVTENILLGLDDPRFFMRLPHYDNLVAELGQTYGMKVDPRAHIWQLSVGEQQRVEILKMLYRGADVLVMDEPTAVLAPQEIESLFATLRAMVSEGKSVIFISHKLQEVKAISDRVTVLRKGRVSAAGLLTRETSRAELARQMVGREVIFRLEKKAQEAGEVALRVQDIRAENDKGLPALNGVTFDVRQGEIVGLAGVAGNGQSELAQVISGLRKCTGGSVALKGEVICNQSTLVGIQRGLAYIPEDRLRDGTAPNLSVTDNVIMKKYRQPPIGKGWMIDMQSANRFANELREAYEIIAPSVDTPVRLLSGGNLQRVILAREISGQPVFLLAVQPTRGLDVGAIEGVQRLLLAQREAGSAVLLISEELDELMSLSDRIIVIYEGRIMGEMKEPNIEALGMMMTGTPLDQIQPHGETQHG
ncbi:MAG: ABC transporter ATP-binding protein [Anaerolineae bacterium]|jgi:simple sugar transport system ATP-binding protein|nr:ABC transporter ATP-binding protein [Anaerolineae bacterium]